MRDSKEEQSEISVVANEPYQQECPHCKFKAPEVFRPIENRVLKDLMDQIKVGHRCLKTQGLKIYTTMQLREHAIDCPGLR